MSSSSSTVARAAASAGMPLEAVVRPFTPENRVEPWLIPDFDTPPAPAAPQALTDVAAVLDAAALAKITHEAAQAGFAQGHQEGHQAGFAVGQAEGLAAGQAELNQMQRRFQGWLQHLANPLAALDREVTLQMARLATQMARAILYRELTLVPEQINLVANAAILALPIAVRQITLVCHPSEQAALQLAIDEGSLSLRGQGEITIQASGAIAAGGLRVESATVGIQAEVDATLEARWVTLCLRILGEVVAGPGDPLPQEPPTKNHKQPSEHRPEHRSEQPLVPEPSIEQAAASTPKTGLGGTAK